jgi:hypothetical protein
MDAQTTERAKTYALVQVMGQAQADALVQVTERAKTYAESVDAFAAEILKFYRRRHPWQFYRSDLETTGALRPILEMVIDDAEVESTDIETLELESPPPEHQDLIDSLERAANAPGLAA